MTTYKNLTERAVAILNRHIVPDGISDKDALGELYGIFDGPDYRAAVACHAAPDAPALAPTAPILETMKFALQDALGFAELIAAYSKPDVEIYKHELRGDSERAENRLNVALQALEDFVTAPALAQPVAAPLDGWISVDADQKPKGRTPILVAVSFVRYGEHEDGTPGEYEGVEVTEGEFVPAHGEAGSYFASYQGTHGDASHVTHWMLLPPAPGAEPTTDTQADRIAALEAKCALLAASLKQADGERDGLVMALKVCYDLIAEECVDGECTVASVNHAIARAALTAAGVVL